MGADTVMIHAAVAAALGLRLVWLVAFGASRTSVDDNADFWRMFSHFCTSVWPLTLVCLVVFYLSGFYTYGRAYQGRYKALIVAQGVTLGFLIYSSLSYLFSGAGFTLPRSALVLSWLFCLGLLVGSRIWTRLWATIVSPEREAIVKQRRGERRVLVIGGGGYIGSALLPKLLEKGYHVRLLDLLIFGDDPIQHVLNHPRLEIRRGDFRHVEQVADALRDVDSVVHLGAIVGDPACNLDEELTIEVNLTATRMIAELAKASGVQRIVFASTCSVYGATEEMLDERSVVKPISLYGHTKLASERVLLSMANDRFRPTILRFSTIYGLSGARGSTWWLTC